MAEGVRAARQGYDANAIETEVSERWATEDTRSRVRKLRAEGERWSFVDGPPYTSGHIHLGTAWNKVMKDVLVRHRTMLGLNVRDQPGYDMHGLPIEVKVERELGIANKQAIEELGLGTFVSKCREFALGYLDTMTEEFKELGVWMDWDHPYRTVDDSYIEGAWWAVKRAHDRQLLYRDNRGGLPWCPRCETALAQAEIEYEDRTDPSVYVRFNAEDEDESFLIWTTTPWTLPANNAIAVHPELTYARVLLTHRDGATETVIVEESLVGSVAHAAKAEDATVVEHLSGEALAGRGYVHPFADEVPYHRERASDNEYRIILADHVTAERTGLVHTATGHGAEDFEAGQANGIAPFCPVGPDGTYTELAGSLEGLIVRKAAAGDDAPEGTSADDEVIRLLDERGALLAQGMDEHSYGHCWRCKTPILYLTTEQWFVAVTKVKDRMLAEVERVHWTPGWAGAARQRDWVENARDWCISRQRYWGIPLPVWVCDACGEHEVIGSRAELLERSGLDDVEELHRPWVDEVTIACSCGGTRERVADVLDVWFDSAVASWASLGYPSDTQSFDAWFPAALIIEGLDQTRGWFYSQLAAGVVAMDRVPYESVVMHGFVHDQDGRPMSKSLGNIVSPSEVIAEYGVDALRWSLLEASAPWDDLHYGPGSARDAQRFLNILWNVHVFATQYMAMDGYVVAEPPAPSSLADPVDRWLVSRLASTVEAASSRLDVHEYHRAVRAVRRFVLEDLSRWYVRLNRDRAWRGSDDEKRTLYALLADTLATVARLMAPFAPHTAEAIWSDLRPDDESVHAQDWPTTVDTTIDASLEREMELARSIVEAVSQARERAGLSLRYPVPKVVLAGSADVRGVAEHLGAVLRDQCNAKEVVYEGEHWGELVVVANPDRSVMGPKLKGDAPAVMQAVREADAAELKRKLEAGPVELAGHEVTEDMVSFSTEVPEGILGAPFEGGSCFVDAHLTPELEAEGLARELLRRIQEMRKAKDLALEEVVSCAVEAGELSARVEPHVDSIEAEGRVQLTFGPAGEEGEVWTIKDHEVRIALGGPD